MQDMKVTKPAMPGEPARDVPEYPYGLRLCLDDESLAKLGMKDLPAIDADYKLTAVACVVRISQDESQGGEPRRSVDLQIEQMELTPTKEEAGESSAASLLYPNQ